MGRGSELASVKYVCLSDLHLGAATALLSDTPRVPAPDAPGVRPGDPVTPAFSAGPLREALAVALAATVSALAPSASDPPGIVLLGDILDLSLGRPKAAEADLSLLAAALKTAFKAQKLGRFIFVPGNHDHELWTAERFRQVDSAGPGGWVHATPAFAWPDAPAGAPIIDRVLKAQGFAGAVTCYPNMGLANADRSRIVMLHHGHFVESMYRCMSALVAQMGGTPEAELSAARLEELNGSWIDFFWSTDGDDGALGRDITLGYDYLMTGSEEAGFEHRLARLLAARIAQSLPVLQTPQFRQVLDMATRGLVDGIVGRYGQMERFSYAQVLGADSLEGLRFYLGGPVLKQIGEELAGAAVRDLTFVFGHTHKPFEDRLVDDRFDLPPAIYNTGGWNLDTPMFSTRIGAAMVFIDDALNVASLRLCSVPLEDGPGPPTGGPIKAHVATADGRIAGNPLAEALQAALVKTDRQWAAFAQASDAAYRAKQAYIIADLRERDRLAQRSGKTL